MPEHARKVRLKSWFQDSCRSGVCDRIEGTSQGQSKDRAETRVDPSFFDGSTLDNWSEAVAGQLVRVTLFFLENSMAGPS